LSSLLLIEVSPGGENSVSRGITKEFVQSWSSKHADGKIITRDFSVDPIPHLDAEGIYAGYTPEADRSSAMATKHAFRMELIEEITSVDEIAISTPMWNWGPPSVLKAYFDQIIIPGVLDGSGAAGLAGKKVTFIVAQGGSYAEGAPRHGWDYQSGYLKLVASALGSTDVELILAELTLAGVVPGMEALVGKKEASIAAAKEAARERAVA
jgi:FMN-dependent NADH-azoreductase